MRISFSHFDVYLWDQKKWPRKSWRLLERDRSLFQSFSHQLEQLREMYKTERVKFVPRYQVQS